MKKIFGLLLVVFATATLAACTGTKRDTQAISINMAAEQSQRLISYLQANALEMPDGTVVTSGDLKPVWQAVEKAVNITITDNAIAAKPKEVFDLEAASRFEGSNIYGGPNLGESIMNAGTEGFFVNLNDHMNKLPNFKAYLKKQPLVENSITAFDGGIYHIPYIAEVGSYARTFNGRQSWVTALLDGKVNGAAFALETEDATIPVSYEAYWKASATTDDKLPYGGLRKTTNVIDLQNAAATGNRLNGTTALKVLKDYIAAQYPSLAKPSDLFLGETAQYDIDELVALWRVMKLFPRTLSKEASGTPVNDATIWPYFARQSNYREELLRLQNYFGGQRVHGSDSYGARFYIDKNGELQYSYAEENFLQNLSRLKGMAAEGLIDDKLFGTADSTPNLRSAYIFSDKKAGHKQFGFMTFDWISSTTAATEGQDDVTSFLPPLTTTPVSNNEFVHYVENARVVKPDGWGIASHTTGDQLDAALELFDFFFSEEGNRMQNYGTPDLWKSEDGFEFKGIKGPEFSDWTLQKVSEVAKGDISTFLRDHIGALIPIGFQKEIGFELQATSQAGFASWDLYAKGNNGKGVIMSGYDQKNPYYQLAPAIISLTSQQQEIVKTTTKMTNDSQITDKVFGYIGGKTGEGIPRSVDDVKALYTDAKADIYLNIYREAFNRNKNK